MKPIIAHVLKALVHQLQTEHPNVVTRAIIYAIAAISVALLIAALAGCQVTSYLDGKTYSWRFDVLTPIGQTANTPLAAPVILHPADPNK